VFRFQTVTGSPRTRVLPSGLKTRAAPPRASRTVNSLPDVGSHSRIVPSAPAEARVLPSGLNTTTCTVSVWPSNRSRSLQVTGSHNRTDLSVLAVARVFPSGLNARPSTPPACPTSLPRGSRAVGAGGADAAGRTSSFLTGATAPFGAPRDLSFESQ